MPTVNEVLGKARKEERCVLIGYVVAGDPDPATTRAVIDAIVDAGVDIVELGIPYGDPLADGPTIAAASQRALASGTNLEAVFRLLGPTKAPVILFTYVNPVLQYGIEKFAQQAKRYGAAGAIIPDVPLEELEQVRAVFRKDGLMMPQLIAPTTPDARAKEIIAATDGFIYLVSRLGVTGSKDAADVGGVKEHAERLRRMTTMPIAAGFGISKAPHVVAIRDSVDGVIVGSALIEAYANQKGADAAAAAAARLVRLLRLACKRVTPSTPQPEPVAEKA